MVILHGIARTHRSMSRFEKMLKKQGYHVLNQGYDSTRFQIQELVDKINKPISAFNTDKTRKIHFVGYSMGGLLIRGFLKKYRPSNLGRVVQVAPPNHGSEVADFLKNFFLFKWIFGPAGQQLGVHSDGFAEMLGNVDFELGVIAGNNTLDPISSFIINGPDDGKVSVKSTQLKGVADHIVIPATHTFIIYNSQALSQTAHFLKFGNFKR